MTLSWWEITYASGDDENRPSERIALVEAATIGDALARYAAWCGCGNCDEAIYAIEQAHVDDVLPVEMVAAEPREQVH